MLAEGQAEMVRDGRCVATLHEGDFFGEIALLTRSVQPATITTSTPTEALVVTDADFAWLVRDCPAVTQAVLRVLPQRFVPLAPARV